MANPQPDIFIKISQEYFEALMCVRLPGVERQVLDFIIRQTWGYGKKFDEISLSQFSKKLKIDRRHIHRAIKSLSSKMMIGVTKNDDTGVLIYYVGKDYQKWHLSPKMAPVTKNDDKLSPKMVTKLSPKMAPTKDNTKDNKDILTIGGVAKQILKRYGEEYKAKFGKTYLASFAKEIKLLKGALDLIGEAELLDLVKAFFQSDDKFITESSYGVSVFISQINKLQKDKYYGIPESVKKYLPAR